jgi:hypothetical protein
MDPTEASIPRVRMPPAVPRVNIPSQRRVPPAMPPTAPPNPAATPPSVVVPPLHSHSPSVMMPPGSYIPPRASLAVRSNAPPNPTVRNTPIAPPPTLTRTEFLVLDIGLKIVDIPAEEPECAICREDLDAPVETSEAQQSTASANASPTLILERLEHRAVKIIPCGHVFGAECLDRWLKENNTCPMCRKVLFKRALPTQQYAYANRHLDLDQPFLRSPVPGDDGYGQSPRTPAFAAPRHLESRSRARAQAWRDSDYHRSAWPSPWRDERLDAPSQARGRAAEITALQAELQELQGSGQHIDTAYIRRRQRELGAPETATLGPATETETPESRLRQTQSQLRSESIHTSRNSPLYVEVQQTRNRFRDIHAQEVRQMGPQRTAALEASRQRRQVRSESNSDGVLNSASERRLLEAHETAQARESEDLTWTVPARAPSQARERASETAALRAQVREFSRQHRARNSPEHSEMPRLRIRSQDLRAPSPVRERASEIAALRARLCDLSTLQTRTLQQEREYSGTRSRLYKLQLEVGVQRTDAAARLASEACAALQGRSGSDRQDTVNPVKEGLLDPANIPYSTTENIARQRGEQYQELAARDGFHVPPGPPYASPSEHSEAIRQRVDVNLRQHHVSEIHRLEQEDRNIPLVPAAQAAHQRRLAHHWRELHDLDQEEDRIQSLRGNSTEHVMRGIHLGGQPELGALPQTSFLIRMADTSGAEAIPVITQEERRIMRARQRLREQHERTIQRRQ